MKPTFPVLLAISVILAAGFILFPQGLERAAARGEAELEVSWLPGSGGESLNIVKSLSWQGQIGRLRLPAAVELKLGKAVQGSFTFEKGQLSLHRGDMELRLFHNAGFRSTLDPIRLLASSRRKEGAGGIELHGRLGRWAGRTLWISEIENTGENGPLLLLDVSLAAGESARRYRYIYLSHDSGWQWRFPKAGPYAVRTARDIHSLTAAGAVGSNTRILGQAAVLRGLDVTRTYRRDLEGLAAMLRLEGLFGSWNWGMDVYRTNPGFLLATGDSDSLGPGLSGMGIRLGRRRSDQSLQLSLGHEQPVAELEELISTAGAGLRRTEPYSQAQVTYRRRLDALNYRLGLGWEQGSSQDGLWVSWETSWPPRRLQVGGRLGGSSPAQVKSRLQVHPMAAADVRWQPAEACWRLGIEIDGAKSPWERLAQWTGEFVYKKRPGETYTYLGVRHKMEQGYWEVAWGRSDQGRLDWYWQEEPQISIRLGRYF
ncbi:MAG: hypothetical protein GX341_09740 [Firmicutes bacterium]|nr:hypothetical protein [Bacillota bacterium]